MKFIHWGKAIKAREPSNERDPYALAVLKNVPGGAAGGYGCATRLCTIKPRPPFVAVSNTIEGGGVLEAIPALVQARNEDSIAKSYMKVRNNKGTMSHMQACKNDLRSF